MATYYAVQNWDIGGQGKCHNLYETFDDACDVIEEKIKAYGKREYNDFQKKRPNREDLLKELEKSDIVKYWTLLEDLCIAKMKVIPKKPKKYTYQYYIENYKTYQTYNTLSGEKGVHEPKKSKTFDSFDEAIDAMDKELRELHEAIGKPYWEPRMNREAFKTYMGDCVASTYDFFNDGGPVTDKYVLVKQDA